MRILRQGDRFAALRGGASAGEKRRERLTPDLIDDDRLRKSGGTAGKKLVRQADAGGAIPG